MYDSPIRLAVSKMTSQFNDDIYNAVVKTGIDVDKDELVRALNYDRNQYEKGYRDGLKASKWISVKERLPEKLTKVITYDSAHKIVHAMEYDGEGFQAHRCVRDEWLYDACITHWMPLPEPPKEEQT